MEEGKIYLPPMWLETHRLNAGSELEYTLMRDGSIRVAPIPLAAMRMFHEFGRDLVAAGVSFEEMMQTIEETRQEIFDEVYAPRFSNDA
jgi:bifunctional DNA-binding transcriptional regulator/antitoxin component of YhaV-PrlF toxin-antitoxin module